MKFTKSRIHARVSLMFIFATLLASLSLTTANEQHNFMGKHLIASYSGCNTEALSNVDALRATMENGVIASGATILQSAYHEFPGNGLTMVILLSESHASIHTYPEHGSCFIDLFTCGDNCSNEKFDAVLRAYLKPSSVHEKILLRHEKSEDF